MKPSHYNFFMPYGQDGHQQIAYNSRSNALALVEKEKYMAFHDYCATGKPIEDEDFVNDLIKGMFLIQDDENELDLLKLALLSRRFNSDSLGLVLTPTSDCNFRCIYCYEKDVIKPTYMSTEIQDKIIELVKSRANSISVLSVTWYGGEPLMALDIVERMSNIFIEICEENNIAYNSTMVTNGYFLNRNVVEKINKLRIKSIQVTIDGTSETHDKRRFLSDGSPTFNTIMKNLEEASDILPNISLRINVDKENISSGVKIAEYLRKNELSKKVFPYIGRVLDYSECYTHDTCFSMHEFSDEDFSNSMSFSEIMNLNILTRYPSLKANYCGADNLHGYVIGSDGALYKCWTDIGDLSRSFGNVASGSQTFTPLYLHYLLFDPTEDAECSKCKLLPICMGGCPYQRTKCNSDNCTTYKYTLNKYIATIVDTMKARNSAQCLE